MSFCTVPESWRESMPRSSATSSYSNRRMPAVALIVIDGDTRLADLTLGAGMVGVVAYLCEGVGGHREPGLAMVEEVAEPLVCLIGRGHPGVLPHGPQPAPVHRGVDASGERRLPGPAKIARRFEALEI